jgi:hypothetical protein
MAVPSKRRPGGTSFRDKVKADSDKQKKDAKSYGYLLLPKDVKVFSPEPGSKVVLDFIPYEVTDEKHPDRNEANEVAVPGSLWYKRPFKVHRNIGANNETVVCLTSIGKKCPICEYLAKRTREGAGKEELDALKPKQRDLYCVIPLGHKKFEEVPHVFDISHYLFQTLLNDELEEDDEYRMFPDIEEGLSLKIRFDSETMGKGDPFASASRIDFLERDKPYTDAILEDVPNLDKVLKVLTYDDLNDKFCDIEDEDKNEEDDKPKKGRREVKADDEEDDKPKKGRKEEIKKPVKKEPEPEEDEVTWDDLKNANPKELKTIIHNTDIQLDIDDYDMDDEESIEILRTDIADLLDIKIPKKPSKKEQEKPSRRESKRPEPEPEEEEELNIPKKERCVACQGTGKNSRGKTCPICNGTGRKPEEQEDDEDDKPVKSTKKKEAQATQMTTSPSKGKCPFGYKFGVNCEEQDECDTCDVWEACMDAKERKK